MLDETPTTEVSTGGATPPDAPAAPRRRRATSPAAKAAAPSEEAPATPEASPAADADDSVPAAKKPARKAPAKKAAPRKKAVPAPDPTASVDPAADLAGGSAPPVIPAPADDDAPPVKRTRRRAAAPVTFVAPVEDEEDEQGKALSGAIAPAGFLSPNFAPARPAGDPEDEDEGIEGGAEGEDGDDPDRPRRRRRGRRGRGRRPDGEAGEDDEDQEAEATGADRPTAEGSEVEEGDGTGTSRRRRRRRSGGAGIGEGTEDPPGTVTGVREPRERQPRAARGTTAADEDGVRGITGSTRMAAKRVRRQEGRDSGRRRPPILSEAEFLARREAVDRVMVVRQKGDRTQMAVLEDGILVEHYVTRASAQSYAGNVYLGRVQNVLPSMEAAFVDIGKGRNAVLYAGEVNYDAQGSGSPRKIEQVLKGGQEVLVQVTKDPMGHKGSRLTSQISLPGRYLVYVPEGSMTGISRKLPENERARLKAILKTLVPSDAGVIIRTAAEGVGEEEIARDVRRLQAQWEVIKDKAAKGGAPVLLHAEPDLVIRVVRDVFNEDFSALVVEGDSEWDTIRDYVEFVAPDLAPRLSRHTSDRDVFAEHRIDEQLSKALDRKVHLPSGGSLVIDRTEAMVVIDVNTGKYVGKGGNLEETVTRNNLEAAEEIARQLRVRDLGGIIVIDFIDMVLESNRDLVVRRLVECLGRDRTKHQVAEVTSLGLVQMTRKRVGQGLLESFSETCDHCSGRGVLIHADPVEPKADRGDNERRDRGERGGRAVALIAAASRSRKVEADPPVTEAPSADEEATGASRGRRRRGGRGTGAPAEPPPAPEQELADLIGEADQTDPADPAAAADQADPARSESGAGVPAVPHEVHEQQPVPAPKRRRRATSRPAGPPEG